MLTTVWAPAASAGTTTAAVESRETEMFVTLSLPLLKMVKERTATFPAAPTVRLADPILRTPQE